MSKGGKKRLAKAVSLLVQSSPKTYQYNPVTQKTQYHQLSFITLTLPDVSKSKDAKFCHKYLLQPMLRIMRNRYKMKSYVWKCELQQNGSVHYHITTELFIEWTKLKQEWNAITRSHGMLDEFRDKYGHDNPNSIDVHSVNSVRDLEAYLIKYISKEYQNDEKLDGKVWDCSKNLKQASYFSSELDFKLHQQVNNDLRQGHCKAIYADRCVILKYRQHDYYLGFSQVLIDKYFSHLTAISEWKQQTPTRKSVSTGTSSGKSNISSTPDTSSSGQQSAKFGMTSRPTSIQLKIPINEMCLWRT